MRHKLVIFGALLLLGTGLSKLYAQEAIPASGGNASGNGGSMSYTIGQIMYTTNTGINGSVAQGVQQPWEISVVTGIGEAPWITLVYSVYPNPAKTYIILKVENYNTYDLTYQLYDIGGNLLAQSKVESNETIIEMSNLVLSTYFLKVNQHNKVVEIFKIIKN